MFLKKDISSFHVPLFVGVGVMMLYTPITIYLEDLKTICICFLLLRNKLTTLVV